MPLITNTGGISSGHPPCFPPTGTSAKSPNVFAEGAEVIREGDAWSIHVNCVGIPDQPVQTGCSATVFVNGKGVSRKGDGLSCGGTVASTGTGTVFAG